MLFPAKKLIVYELNEVPDRVLRWYVERDPDSPIARMLNHGRYASSVAEDSGILSPWTTWATLHRGVTNDTHTIADLGQNLDEIDADYPPIWRLLKDAGISTGVFGSLHSYPPPADIEGYTYYMPDTFATGPEAHPKDLEPFQAFNLSMVDTSGRNVDSGLPIASAASFLVKAPFLGLRAGTIMRVGKQILDERMEPIRRVRRRTTQTDLAFDFFLAQLRKSQPQFTTFFTNHVASTMHRYWPATFPQDYSKKDLPDGWEEQYSGELLYTMDVANRHIGELQAFCRKHPEHALVVISSMGQAAVDNDEIVLSQLYVEDRTAFFGALGIAESDWEARRVMLPRYVQSLSGSAAKVLRAKLPTVRINGEPIIHSEHTEGVFMVKFGHINLDEDTLSVEVEGKPIDWRSAGLKVTPIQDATGSYAYHVPEGIVLVWDPEDERAETVNETIPTQAIAPAMLQAYGVTPPAHMS